MNEREQDIFNKSEEERLIEEFEQLKKQQKMGNNVCVPLKDVLRKIRQRLGLDETPIP